MNKRAFLMLAGAAGLAGCGRLAEGPLGGLFGRSRDVASNTSNPASDPRPLVRQIIDLRLERVPGGAIIHATGLPTRQGYFDADLVPLNGGRPVNGVLSYQFRVTPPTSTTPVGSARSREVIVGLFVSQQMLDTARSIQVSAATNALAVGS